jgi:hypothetical protein
LELEKMQILMAIPREVKLAQFIKHLTVMAMLKIHIELHLLA